MVSPTSLLLFAACLIPTVLSAPAGSDKHIRRREEPCPDPIPPSQDPWYTAPDGFEETAPGTVLRIRKAPGNLTQMAANCSGSFNILYRTTDSRYKPAWAVTTLYVPVNKLPGLLSYQVPYDTAYVDASPSFSVYTTGASYDVNNTLSQGYFISVPDYEGPLASFTAGVLSGHATIDSVRAVLNAADKYDLDPEARYALWGYSGGALASEWAAELAVQYAPEMNFSGVALGGLTPNVTSVLLNINGKLAAGLAPASILGISTQYPEVHEYLLSRLKEDGPYNKTGFLATLKLDLGAASVAYAFHDIGAYFIGGLADLLGPLPTLVANRDGTMGYHGVPQMPVFVYKAIQDEISNVTDTDALVARFCGVGANIRYHKNTVGTHSEEFTNGWPAAEAFVMAVLGGTYAQNYPTSGCSAETVTVDLSSTDERKARMIRRGGVEALARRAGVLTT